MKRSEINNYIKEAEEILKKIAFYYLQEMPGLWKIGIMPKGSGSFVFSIF